MMRSIPILFLLITLTHTTNASTNTPTKPDHASPQANVGSAPLRFASPLQTLTILDKKQLSTPRDEFLPKFRAGLTAEHKARSMLAGRRAALEEKESSTGGVGAVGMVGGKYDAEWAKKAEEADKKRRRDDDAMVERAYDAATRRYSSTKKLSSAAAKGRDPNKYQFVGIINPKTDSKPVRWYARPKPKGAAWSVRLVHVNKEAIVRDLFTRGKVDVFGEYVNTGKKEERSGKPALEGKYTVKERSWRTLWNFNPKHFFTDPSGMYWRERRLPRPGLYTDGRSVYETSFRYHDGRNGMKRVSSLPFFLQSKMVSEEIKKDLNKRLQGSSPDVVIEK